MRNPDRVIITQEFPPEKLPRLGWGPHRRTFTMKHPAPFVTLNSIVDNSVAGDERPFLAVSHTGHVVVDHIIVHDRDRLTLRVFYGNDAAPNTHLVATNTRITILMPHRPARRTWALAELRSDNAKPRLVWDTCVFEGARPFALYFIPGSATIVNNAYPNGRQLSDTVTTTGALIGFKKMDGRISSDDREWSGWVDIGVRVGMIRAPA